MSARISDSATYGHLWGTSETRDLFEEARRIAAWVDILAALARAQAAVGLIPEEAADAIGAPDLADRLDLTRIAELTRATGHSTQGLILELQRHLPAHAREHVYVGATVQDVTDTWSALTMRQVTRILHRDLTGIEECVTGLVQQHGDALMCGRTHGQPGAPITFGWKVASWIDEIGRHLDRLGESLPRWSVGQLGGGLGTLVAYGERGLEVRKRFCAELGLSDPGISWLSARDRIFEFGSVLTGISGTLARIGDEVYELQRPEIGELGERHADSSLSSITMHHKRNPESSEHLNTLARLVRAQNAVLAESLVSQHERDGRSWKAEWVALPEAALLTCTASGSARTLTQGLEVHTERMADNLRTYLGDTQNPTDPGQASAMVDRVLAQSRARRDARRLPE